METSWYEDGTKKQEISHDQDFNKKLEIHWNQVGQKVLEIAYKPDAKQLVLLQVDTPKVNGDGVLGYFEGFYSDMTQDKANSGIYRKLLKVVTSQGYLVQDFYTENNQKINDPILVYNYQVNPLFLYDYTVADTSYRVWYANGQLRSEVPLKKGLEDGITQVWSEKGQLVHKRLTKQGVLEGKIETWYENGQLFSVRPIKQGRIHGTVESWHKNGLPNNALNYLEGLPSGIWSYWYENGQKQAEGNVIYRNGVVLTGTWRYWTMDGKQMLEINYDDQGQVLVEKNLLLNTVQQY